MSDSSHTMNKPFLLSLAGAAVLALFAGCQTEPGPFLPQETTKYTLENSERFVVMDKRVQHSVTCTGLQEGIAAVYKWYLESQPVAA